MRKLLPILFSLLFLLIFSTRAFSSPTTKFTAQVLDENGLPIQGAQVTLSFSGAKRGDGGGLTSFGKKGFTNSEGLFADSAETLPLVGVVVDKDGYYRSIQKYEFKSSSMLLNRWEPWNPTIEVVLKKKRNPVAMYSKYNESLKMPVSGKSVGYDLEKGDWVAPYGSGVMSDFIFTFSSVDRAWTDYECCYTLSFPNEKDGIQEYSFDKDNQSSYKWLFIAPEGGYLPVLQKERHDTPKTGLVTNTKEKINYLFRVRTKTDKQGNIVEAMYGKIEGEINVWPGKVRFFYYLNPDGTRNLEEDSKKNLFKNK